MSIAFFKDKNSIPPQIDLYTSKYTLFFDTKTAFARRISAGGVEVIRAVYAAVRDHQWNTAEQVISNVNVMQDDDEFALTFDADCMLGAAKYFYHGAIIGNGGRLAFIFDGEARSAFHRNRIGFCVLHPIEGCAGNDCELQHTDGSREQSLFPKIISPHQPFKDLRGMRWKPTPGLTAELEFSGDTFETEDQRNWTDASFKTYCTPLSIPFPVEVSPGDRVQQSISLQLSRDSKTSQSAVPRNFSTVTVGPSSKNELPPIGFCLGSHGQPLDTASSETLRKLKPSHLRADLHLHREGWKDELRRAAADARAIDTTLHCALFVSDALDNELTGFINEALQISAPVARCYIFHSAESVTSHRHLETAECLFLQHEFKIEIIGGTNAYFTDLNRNRPPAGKPAAFSINPQVHAFDDVSLIENLEGQKHVVSSAAAFTGAPVAVSPITLLPRKKQLTPDATASAAEKSKIIDPRQRTDFNAVWTLGSLAALGPRSEVLSLTYHELTGCRGLIETPAGSQMPEHFPSKPCEIFPVYRVFEAIAGCRKLFDVTLGAPQKITALGIVTPEGKRRLILGNLLPEGQTVQVITSGNEPQTYHLWSYGLKIIDLGS